MSELKVLDKPFVISKWTVQMAWEKVRANRGAPGVDGQSIEAFEKDLKNNLFKIWNRMSSEVIPTGVSDVPCESGCLGSWVAWRGARR